MMKRETAAAYRKIVAQHEANEKIAFHDEPIPEEYWQCQRIIKELLTDFIRREPFGLLSSKDILTLVYLCYKYSCMPLHSLGMACDKQAYLLKD